MNICTFNEHWQWADGFQMPGTSRQCRNVAGNAVCKSSCAVDIPKNFSCALLSSLLIIFFFALFDKIAHSKKHLLVDKIRRVHLINLNCSRLTFLFTGSKILFDDLRRKFAHFPQHVLVDSFALRSSAK